VVLFIYVLCGKIPTNYLKLRLRRGAVRYGGQVGGKKAGLLNFSSSDCPYQTKEAWQYGTKVLAYF
jgi:hypothetical protein